MLDLFHVYQHGFHNDTTPRYDEAAAGLSYFSLATLTTTGYGDLVPVHHLARSMANMEAVFGQLCVKYLNNVIGQDHGFIKKKVRASQCFKSSHTAGRTLEGIEAVNMIRKGQVKRLAGSDVGGQATFNLPNH